MSNFDKGCLGCLGVVGGLIAFGFITSAITEIVRVNTPPQTPEERIRADKANYAKAVKVFRDKNHVIGSALPYLYNISKQYSGYSEVKRMIAIEQHNKRVVDEALNRLIRKRSSDGFERAFLDDYTDATVTVTGEKYDRINIRTARTSRVFVYHFQDSKIYREICELGFKRITFTDPYTDETYSWNIDE